MDFYQQTPIPKDSITFRRLDVNRYMVTFLNTDSHTPDMIAWILKQRPEHQELVSFVATKPAGLGEDSVVKIEIHLKKICDVAELVSQAASQAAASIGQVKHDFVEALKT
jgi:hypothetical protein